MSLKFFHKKMVVTLLFLLLVILFSNFVLSVSVCNSRQTMELRHSEKNISVGNFQCKDPSPACQTGSGGPRKWSCDFSIPFDQCKNLVQGGWILEYTIRNFWTNHINVITYDFDISYDTDKRWCECSRGMYIARTGGKNWLDDKNATMPREYNYCCGNDPFNDVGFFARDNSGNLHVCVQHPDSTFEWIRADKESSFATSPNWVRGNTYEVFKESYYNDFVDKSKDAALTDYTQGKPIPSGNLYSIVSDGDKFHICTGQNTKIKGTLLGPDNFKMDQSNLQNINDLKIHHSGAKLNITGPIGGQTYEYSCVEENGFYRWIECRGTNSIESSFDMNSRSTQPPWFWSGNSIGTRDSLFPLITADRNLNHIEYIFRSEGGPVSTTSDSSRRISGVNSLRINFQKGADKIVASLISNNSIRNNFSDGLIEGWLYLDDVTPITMGFYENSHISSDPLKTINLEQKIIGPIKPQSWHYFKFNISIQEPVEAVRLILDSNNLANFKESKNYFFNLDSVSYIPSNLDKPFCGADFTFKQKRSDNKVLCNEFFTYVNENMCCGDSENQFGVSNEGGCWDSRPIKTGDRFEPVSFKIKIGSQEIQFNEVCYAGKECRFLLPRINNSESEVRIISESSGINVTFVSSGNKTTNKFNDRINVEVSDYSFILTGGKFRYCGSNFNRFSNIDQNLLVNEIQARQQTRSCSVENLFYCSENGWVDTARAERRDLEDAATPREADNRGDAPHISEFVHLKSVPEDFKDDVEFSTGCCPEDYCWTGERCVFDQTKKPHRGPSFAVQGGNGYRCLDGDWVFSTAKYPPNDFTPGYCSEDSQCLLSLTGRYEDNGDITKNPQCLNDGQFVGDFLCDDGSWSSRTRILAENMLSATQTSNDFSLFCDSYDWAFNNLDISLSGKNIEEIVMGGGSCRLENLPYLPEIPCMNNFCILETKNGIAFGTTLNLDLKNESVGIRDTFGIENVNTCTQGTGLKHCFSGRYDGKTISWYYDTEIGMLIGSEFTIRTGTSFLDNLFSTIRGWLSTDLSKQLDLTYNNLADNLRLEYSDSNQRYDRLFFMKKGSMSVVAINGQVRDVISGRMQSYVGVEYKNFQFRQEDGKRRNICEYSDIYRDRSINSKIVCSLEQRPGSPYYVFITIPSHDNHRVNVWRDLTSKLRLI